jgi:vacuolar-type H+-ATPase subunit I/STV1
LISPSRFNVKFSVMNVLFGLSFNARLLPYTSCLFLQLRNLTITGIFPFLGSTIGWLLPMSLNKMGCFMFLLHISRTSWSVLKGMMIWPPLSTVTGTLLNLRLVHLENCTCSMRFSTSLIVFCFVFFVLQGLYFYRLFDILLYACCLLFV